MDRYPKRRVHPAALGLLVVATVGGSLLLWREKLALRQAQEAMAEIRAQQAERARIVAENAAFEREARTSESDIARLRLEVQTLTHEIDTLLERAASARPGFVPPQAWQDSGRETPGKAFETLMAGRQALDFESIGQGLVFATPGAAKRADAAWRRLSDSSKQRLGVRSPEALVAFFWVMDHVIGASRVRTAYKPDAATANLAIEYQTCWGTTQTTTMVMVQTAEGWKRVISSAEIDRTLDGLKRLR